MSVWPTNAGSPDGRHRHRRAVLPSSSCRRNDLRTLGAYPLNDHGQCAYRFSAVAAAVMQQDDVAAANVILAHKEEVRQNILGNLLAASPRIVAPIIGIDLVPDGDIAKVLRRLPAVVPRLRYPAPASIEYGGRNRYGSNSQAAGEEPFGQVQLEPSCNRLEMLLMSGWVKVWLPILWPSL